MSIQPVPMSLYDQDFDAFARRLGEAFERYGFAIVAEHGLDPDRLAGANDRAKAFFALPEAVKRRYHVPGGAGQRGYTPFGVETAKGAQLHDLKEFWHTGRELPPGHPYRAYMPDNLWPSEIEGFRPYVGGLFEALDDAQGGQSGPRAPGGGALFLALLPALRAGLPDPDPAGLRERGEPRPLSDPDHRRRVPQGAAARDQAGLRPAYWAIRMLPIDPAMVSNASARSLELVTFR